MSAPRHDSGRTPEKEDGRAARARSTRARIIAAATRLFTTSGYASTSINAIAAEARVGEQTVYYAFGTKRAILTAALDRAVAGDDEPVPTLERPWAREAIADPDPLGQLRRQVAGAGEIYSRAAPLLDVVRSAASTDPTSPGSGPRTSGNASPCNGCSPTRWPARRPCATGSAASSRPTSR
ncbi:TetR/AcrR family transcriptional regulator [[Actinomadura] parvosata]|uniref:TetR/AcrR family transcriptional regulator n=1 Tax=[Actinomadura] parvosata TaxID=1955412 RepID=UPI001FE78457